jgi:hypothetical protein
VTGWGVMAALPPRGAVEKVSGIPRDYFHAEESRFAASDYLRKRFTLS